MSLLHHTVQNTASDFIMAENDAHPAAELPCDTEMNPPQDETIDTQITANERTDMSKSTTLIFGL